MNWERMRDLRKHIQSETALCTSLQIQTNTDCNCEFLLKLSSHRMLEFLSSVSSKFSRGWGKVDEEIFFSDTNTKTVFTMLKAVKTGKEADFRAS